jgi:hypothetical protein
MNMERVNLKPGDAVVVRFDDDEPAYGVIESIDAYGVYVVDPFWPRGYVLPRCGTILVAAQAIDSIISAAELDRVRDQSELTRPFAIDEFIAALPQE